MTGKSDTKRQVLIGVGWMVAWRFATRILGFLTTLVLARLLVPADFGLVAIASSFAAAIQGLSQFALTDALVRREDDARHLYDTTFTLQIIRSVFTGLMIAALAPAAANWFGDPRLLPVILVLAGVSCLSGFVNIGVLEFKRNIDFSQQFYFNAVPRLVQVAVTLALALVVQSYWILVVGAALDRAGTMVMSYVVHPYRPRLALRGWREIMGFSIWTWAASLALIVWTRGDPIILGPALGNAALGAYTLGLEIAVLPITELVVPATDVLFTGFAKTQRQGASVSEQVLEVASLLFLLVMPLAIGISCTGGYVVAVLLGEKWHGAQQLVMVGAWLCLFSPLTYVCGSALVASGRVRTNFYATALAALVRLLALLLAVQFTRDLMVITATQVACVGAESVFYLAGIRTAGPLRWRHSMGGLLRIGLAGLVTTIVMWRSGLAWHEVSLPTVEALWHGGLIGGASLLVYAAAQAAIWVLAGRPDGPEMRSVAMIRATLPAPFGRLRPSVRP